MFSVERHPVVARKCLRAAHHRPYSDESSGPASSGLVKSASLHAAPRWHDSQVVEELMVLVGAGQSLEFHSHSFCKFLRLPSHLDLPCCPRLHRLQPLATPGFSGPYFAASSCQHASMVYSHVACGHFAELLSMQAGVRWFA